MFTSAARRFLIHWQVKRQLRKIERQTWARKERIKARRDYLGLRRQVQVGGENSVNLQARGSIYTGTGSSVTFRDEPLVPKPPDVSWIEFKGDPPKVYADEVE